MKKKHAFLVCLVSLLAIYGATLILAPDAISAIGPSVVLGIVGAGGFSLGANVADNWQRSKYYQPELTRREQ